MSAFKDLTGQRFGPNGDLYVDRRAEGSRDGKALWWVIHDIARGGCGLEHVVDSRRAQDGRCQCRRGAAFKQQVKGRSRLFPLTEHGRVAIAEGNRRKKQASKLPRTSDGILLGAGNLRGFKSGAGRRRKYSGTEAERNSAAQRAWRVRRKEANLISNP